MIDLEYDVRLQSSETLRFVLPADDPKADTLVEDQMMRWRNKFFYIDEIISERDGAAATIEVKLNAAWMRLNDRKKVGGFVLTAVDAASGMELILAESPDWTPGPDVAAISGSRSLDVQDTTLLDCLWRWAKAFNKEVEFDTVAKTVNFVDSVGTDNGFTFRYGRNLQTVKRTARAPKTTRLYPFGRDDLDISGHTNGGVTYIEDYSFYEAQGLTTAEAAALYRRDEILSDIDIVDSAALYARAVSRLAANSQPWAKYEATVQDLSEITGITETLIVGDTVRVYDSVFNWNFTTRVARYQEFPLEPWRNKVELSTLDDSSLGEGTSSRGKSALEWILFNSDTATDYYLRNDATWITNRIPLAFGNGGEAVFGCTVSAIGVGVGSLSVSAYDAESNALLHPVQLVPYTDGETITSTITFAAQGLTDQFDYRIRVKAINDGGPSVSGGVDIPTLSSRFWILARSAVRRPPRASSNQTFRYVSNAAQQFTVPDGITEVTIEAAGGTGGVDSVFSAQANGCIVTATFQVVPGTVYDVYVPDAGPVDTTAGGWPDGGNGDAFPSTAFEGMGGGGSARVIPSGGALAAAIIVAAAGGGQSEGHPSDAMRGGDGGFFTGDPGLGVAGGGGATQYAGGAAGVGSVDNGDPGVFGDGGDAGDVTFHGNCPGGGGGGWYGGGGGGVNSTGFGQKGGGGGGGSGFISEDGYDLQAQDGANTPSGLYGGEGYVIFSWDTPEA